jgi:hypothetical protein
MTSVFLGTKSTLTRLSLFGMFGDYGHGRGGPVVRQGQMTFSAYEGRGVGVIAIGLVSR